jgi:hypothetical protein
MDLLGLWTRLRIRASGGSYRHHRTAVIDAGDGPQRFPSLTPSITLSGKCDDGIAKLIATSCTVRNVWCLSLEPCKLTIAGYRILASLPNLSSVSLYGDEALAPEKALAFATCPSLREMLFCSDRFSDSHLCQLPFLRRLQGLYLSHTAITDDAMTELVKKDTTLSILALSNTRVGDVGLQSLSPLMLSAIYLSNTRVSDECLEEFRLRNPSCEVHTDKSGPGSA